MPERPRDASEQHRRRAATRGSSAVDPAGAPPPGAPAPGASAPVGTPDFAQFFLRSSQLLCTATFDGMFEELSPALCALLGYHPDELTSRPYLDLVHPADLERTMDTAAALSRGGAIQGLENRFRHRDGSYRWLRWEALPCLAEGRIYAIAHDITEQRRREAMAAELEQVTAVGTWELNVDTRETYRSPLTRSLFGEDAPDRSTLDGDLDAFPPEARAVLEEALAGLLERGQAYELELPFTPCGDRRWVRATGRAQTRDGRVVLAYGTFQDVTHLHEERERLRHYRALVEESGEGILSLDRFGVVSFANPRLAALVGIPHHDLRGRSVLDLFDLGSDDRHEHWANLLREGTAARFEARVRRDDDVEIWVQVAARASRTPGGALRSVTAVVTDVSERRRRELELDAARAHLEQAQRLARLATWEIDVVADQLQWSPRVYTMFGVDPTRFVPDRASVQELIHPDDLPAVRASKAASRRTGHHEVTYRVRRPDGQERILHEMAWSSIDARGRLVRLVGTVQDVTRIKQAELALRTSEQRLQRVLRATNDGWWDHDLRSDETFHSDRFYEIHGYTREELQESPSMWRSLTHPDDLAAMDAEVARVMRERGATFEVTGRVRHKDGHLVDILGRGFIEYDDEGRPVRMSGSTTDVSGLRQAERVKEEFVSTVSHELRTPLTSIGGALELLEAGVGGALPATSGHLLEVAKRNTVRLRTLIDDLLDMELLLAGRRVFALRERPVIPLVEQTLIDHAPYAQRHEVSFAFSPPTTPIWARIDANRIQQVLTNYLSNAAKFAPAGSTVQVRLRAVDGTVRVEVVDSGPGVPDSFADRVFQRFEQADPSDPRSRGGTGLGLAISREIVEGHGGQVGFDSQPGRTCFWFDLPTVPAPGPEQTHAANGRPPASGRPAHHLG